MCWWSEVKLEKLFLARGYLIVKSDIEIPQIHLIYFFLQELSKLILKQRREARNEKDLYKKMLGRAEKLDEKNKKSDGSNKTVK